MPTSRNGSIKYVNCSIVLSDQLSANKTMTSQNLPKGAAGNCGFELQGGRGWTECAKEAPGLHSYLAPTPATPSRMTAIHCCTPTERFRQA